MIYEGEKDYRKINYLKDYKEAESIINGIKVLEENIPETIQSPISFDINNKETDILKITYTQKS